MKKYIVFLFLIFMSCEKDIIEISDIPTQTMVFDLDEVFIQDGQDISFKIIANRPHQLIITNEENSVVAKETFTPTLGINTRKIYTKSLSPNIYNLILMGSESEIGRVKIIVD